jgi:hypothetical protein
MGLMILRSIGRPGITGAISRAPQQGFAMIFCLSCSWFLLK